MPEEGFLRRWARVKATGADAAPEPPPAPAPAPVPPVSPWARAGDVGPEDAPARAPAPAGEPAAPAGRLAPTLEDVAQLTPDSDYSIFVGQGVDKSVQRQALKKLFADPHFNVMDRLDMYMDDYNKPSPVSAAMLASLDHARSALRRVVEEEPAVATHVDSTAGETAASADQHIEMPHNEAAHAAAAHCAPLPGEAASGAFLPDAGLSDSPNPQLSQGQA